MESAASPRPKTPGQGAEAATPKQKKPVVRRRLVTDKAANLSKVPRDENGGVLMLDEDVEAAFKFLDVKQTSKVTLLGLKQRFGVFYNSLPVQRIKNMMDGRQNFTLDMLKELVMDNGITDFDPVAEAFKVYDRENLGYLTSTTLRDLFAEADIKEIDDEDLQILVESCDLDKDGQIGLDDFRLLGQVNGGGPGAQANPSSSTKFKRTATLHRTLGLTGSAASSRHPVSFHQTLKNLTALADGDFTVLTRPHFMESMQVVDDSGLMEVLRKEVLHDPGTLRELLRMTVQNKFHLKKAPLAGTTQPSSPKHMRQPPQQPPSMADGMSDGQGGSPDHHPSGGFDQSTHSMLMESINSPVIDLPHRRVSVAAPPPTPGVEGAAGSRVPVESQTITNLEHLLETSMLPQQQQGQASRRPSSAAARRKSSVRQGPPGQQQRRSVSSSRRKSSVVKELTDSQRLLELLGSTGDLAGMSAPAKGGGRRRSSAASSVMTADQEKFVSGGNNAKPSRRESRLSSFSISGNNRLERSTNDSSGRVEDDLNETMALLSMLDNPDGAAPPPAAQGEGGQRGQGPSLDGTFSERLVSGAGGNGARVDLRRPS